MVLRPWQETPPIRLDADNPAWVDPGQAVEFVVSPGRSMPWIVKGPGLAISTRSLADANNTARVEADRYNQDRPGMATAVIVPEN